MPDQQPHDSSTSTDPWCQFVTQTDWQGTVTQESWYGHGTPCTRLSVFVHLSSLISMMVLLVRAMNDWPMFYPYLTTAEWNRIQDSHYECATALCQAVAPIQVHCEKKSNGRIVMDTSLLLDDRVPLPQECHDALRLSFGEDFERNLLDKRQTSIWDENQQQEEEPPFREIDLVHFRDLSQEPIDNIPIFRFLQDECLVEESLLGYLFLGQISLQASTGSAIVIDLVDSLSMKPGSSEVVDLRTFACPQYMSRRMRDEILPKSKQLYDHFLYWRWSGAVCFIYWGYMMYHAAMCATRMLMVLLPGLVLWLVLSVRDVRGKRLSLTSTVSMLLLLTTLASEGDGGTDEMIRTGLLVTSALVFGNPNAAMEWAFLFVLSYVDLGNLWESPAEIEDPTSAGGKLMLWIDTLLWFFVPGDGLWKLVTIYVVYMALPRKR